MEDLTEIKYRHVLSLGLEQGVLSILMTELAALMRSVEHAAAEGGEEVRPLSEREQVVRIQRQLKAEPAEEQALKEKWAEQDEKLISAVKFRDQRVEALQAVFTAVDKIKPKITPVRKEMQRLWSAANSFWTEHIWPLSSLFKM